MSDTDVRLWEGNAPIDDQPSPRLEEGKREDESVAAELVASWTPKQTRSRSASLQVPLNDHVISIPAAQPEASKSAIPSPSRPKPKSSKQRKFRSPSPLPVLPPPPRLTVRLDTALSSPEHYEVDVASLALQTGQRLPTLPPIKRAASDSEGEDTDDDSKKVKGASHKRSRAAVYDLNDPFIDDLELAIDDRTHFAQTKQQGFYVSSGKVALLKDKTSPKKPKSKRPLILSSAAAANIQPLSHAAPPPHASAAHPPHPPSHTAASIPQDGTRESPITLLDDDDSHKPPPKRELRPGHNAANESGDAPKKRRKMQVLASIEALKVAIAAESFEVKGMSPSRNSSPTANEVLALLAEEERVLEESMEELRNRRTELERVAREEKERKADERRAQEERKCFEEEAEKAWKAAELKAEEVKRQKAEEELKKRNGKGLLSAAELAHIYARSLGKNIPKPVSVIIEKSKDIGVVRAKEIEVEKSEKKKCEEAKIDAAKEAAETFSSKSSMCESCIRRGDECGWRGLGFACSVCKDRKVACSFFKKKDGTARTRKGKKRSKSEIEDLDAEDAEVKKKKPRVEKGSVREMKTSTPDKDELALEDRRIARKIRANLRKLVVVQRTLVLATEDIGTLVQIASRWMSPDL